MFLVMENFQVKDFNEDQNHQERDDHHIHSEETEQVAVLQSLNHDHNRDLDQLSHICNVCGKSFRGRRALGCHKIIHFQRTLLGPKKIIDKFKAKQQEVLQYPPLNNKNSFHVCNKSFPSMKSLCGHMSYHPERDWRGIRPPSMKHKASSSSSEYLDDDPLIAEDYGLVASWAKEDRRIRKNTSSSTVNVNQTPNNTDFSRKSKLNSSISEKLNFLDGFNHRYVCNICYKTFGTGQALSGHKRAHYFYYDHSARPVLETPAAQVSSVDDEVGEAVGPIEAVPLRQFISEEANQLASRKILDLDLNELTTKEEHWSNQ